ncbi:MAG: amino acid adenylation domain-containing protein [Kiritimatiellia bacterium]
MQSNVLEYLEKGALTVCPEKTAIIDGEVRLTFRQLDVQARQCAMVIIQKSGVPKQPIAVFLPRCADAVIADLGIVYSGNCYANLDSKSPRERLKKILDNLGAPVVITSASLAPILRSIDIPIEQVLLVDALPTTDVVPGGDKLLQARLEGLIDTDPLYIMHTSGSTGIPKGVTIPHRGVIDYIDWALKIYPVGESDVIGNQAPFYFDNSTLDFYLSFATGATLNIIPDQWFSFPAKLIDYLCETGVTTIFWVPSIMTNIANSQVLGKSGLPPLRNILFAGEVMPTRTVNHWRKFFSGALFSNLYGPTEITVDCTYYIVDREFSDDEKLPIGFPCRNTDVLILNDRNEAAAVNEPGELCVRGTSLAMGYWNDPEKTAKAFVQNPLNAHYPELIYRTGDLVFKNERGEIMFTGRKDFQIKHMGYRIELGEIEHAAMQLENIRNACVVYNPERKEIALYYESDAALTPAAIRERMSAHVPKYMLPTVFHRMDALPRNPNGKIDRQTLASQVAAASNA